MNGFPDLLLSLPIPRAWLQGLLFAGFFFHLLFVLLLLGTALLAVFYSIKDELEESPGDTAWSRRILRTFMAHKSIAVVLGVAPLLLIQLGHAVPFFNATSLFAPRWLLIIVFLIPVSLIFDSLAHHAPVRRGPHIALAVVALVLLLNIPANFVGVLVAAEQSASWGDMIRSGYRLAGPLMLHGLLRYLHVLAAAVIFGALFHYIFTAGRDGAKRSKLLNWMLFGVMSQAVIGPMLSLTLVLKLDRVSLVLLLFGLLALAGFIRILVGAGGGAKELNLRVSVSFLLVILLFMLLVRQHQQDRAFAPVERRAGEAARRYASLLEPYREAAVGRYRDDLETVYDNGVTIYGKSCAFCHSTNGDGDGPEAGNLSVPPEAVADIRAARPYVHNILTAGIAGSAMPYFTVFTRPKLEMLIDLMNERWRILDAPPAVEGVPPADKEEAERVYGQVCAGCHGRDGRPTQSALKFKPPPPDFAQYSLLPGRALRVMSEGYHGTVMGPFGQALKPEVRTALVQVLYDLRRK
jgi:mono/diheme cytochrome c family protein